MTIATENPDEILEILGTTVQNRNEPNFALANAISTGLALPGLVGFWPMSSIQRSTGNAYDLSGQSRTLTYNGNPTYNWDSLAPYIDFDGTGDFLRRADETDLDILGTETIYANPGLTLGGWFYFDTVATTGLMSKWTVSLSSSWIILLLGTGAVQFLVDDGATTPGVTAPASTVATGQWYCIISRFTPSTELAIFINGTKTTNLVGVIAAIQNSVVPFDIGAWTASALYLNGRSSMNFLCASALSDSIIQNLFQQTRTLYGV